MQAYICDIGVPTCRCYRFQQTGKLCVHLTAGRLLRSNGPVEEWKGESNLYHGLTCTWLTYMQSSNAQLSEPYLPCEPSNINSLATTQKKAMRRKEPKHVSDKYRDDELRHMVKRLEGSGRPSLPLIERPCPSPPNAAIQESEKGCT